MKFQSGNSLKEKLIGWGRQLKAILGKDYSLDDLKNLSVSLSAFKLGTTSNTSELEVGNSIEKEPSSLKHQSLVLVRLIASYRNLLWLLLATLIVWLMATAVIPKFVQTHQNRLDMRPSQWSQLENLIKLSKVNSTDSPTVVPMLDDLELQKIRSTLSSRGFKIAVLRMTTDTPPRIEFQASDVLFATLIDALDELRVSWHLYPEQLKVIAGSGVGVVNVSGVLLPYSAGAAIGRAQASGAVQ